MIKWKLLPFLCLLILFVLTISAAAATGNGSSGSELSRGPILAMTKTAGENVQFGAGPESFYYALMQPSELYSGNAINLVFSASHYQNAALTIRTTGLDNLPQSIIIRQFHDLESSLPTKFTYEQKMLAKTSSNYLVDLSLTHDEEASDASLYFVFTGGDAKLELELTVEGKTLMKKSFDFLVDSQKGTAELVLQSNPNATVLQKAGTVAFGIGLADTKSAGTIQADMASLAKQTWKWSADIKTTGGITLAEQGNLPVPKDSIVSLGQRQWFIRTVQVADAENKTGSVEITWGNPIPEFTAYATDDGAIAVNYLRLYHEWKYDLVNRPPGTGAVGLVTIGDTASETQRTTDTAESSLQNAAIPMSPLVKYSLISLGGVTASTGFFFLFLFFFHTIRYLVKISGVVLADSADQRKIEQGRLLKESRATIKSNGITRIDLTGPFDFTDYTCVKISWDPKAFRWKRNFTIQYLFDGKILHEDFFLNSKEAVSERIIEMIKVPLVHKDTV